MINILSLKKIYMEICNNCFINFLPKDKRYKKFCSKSCSVSYTNKLRINISDQTKQKISNSLKSLNDNERIPKFCRICNDQFFSYKRRQTTCSKRCGYSLAGTTIKKLYEEKILNNGGYREGSGRGKSGYYNGIFINSTYEAAFLIYNLDHNISIERNLQGFKYFDPKRNQSFMYYPDFRVNGKLIEIKGFKSELDLYKLSSVNEDITILYKDDLLDIFNYVENKTNIKIKFLFKLYDNFKPKYQKICSICNKAFYTQRKKALLCSRTCAGIHASKIWRTRRGSNPQ